MYEQWMPDLLQGLPIIIASLVFGTIAIWHSRQRAAIEKTKLKLELFEKRHDVFLATWKFLSDLVRKSPITTKDILTFSTNTASAKFLFGDEIIKFLDESMMQGIRLGTAEHTLSQLVSEKARSEAYAERHELVIWAENELKQVKDRFKPYLDLSQQ